MRRILYSVKVNRITSISVSILFVLPLFLRIYLQPFFTTGRVYDEIKPELLILDPSVIAFYISGLLYFLMHLKYPKGFTPIFRAPLVFFVAYALLATCYGIFRSNPFLSLFIGFELLVYIAITAFFISMSNSNPSQYLSTLESVTYIFICTLVTIALVDIILPFTEPFSIEPMSKKMRFDGSLLHLVSIQWSVISVTCFLFSLGFLFRERSNKFFHSLVFISSISVFMLSCSRGALAGGLIACIVFILLERKKKYYKMAAFLLVPIIAISLLFVFSSDELLRFFRLQNIENLYSFGGRTKHWENALPILKSNLLVGYGIGTRGLRPAGLEHSMHNSFLEAWACAGIFGMLLFLFGILMTFRKLINTHMFLSKKQIKSGQFDLSIVNISLSVLTYLVIHGLVESNLAGVNNPFSVFLLYCVAVSQSAGLLKMD